MSGDVSRDVGTLSTSLSSAEVGWENPQRQWLHHSNKWPLFEQSASRMGKLIVESDQQARLSLEGVSCADWKVAFPVLRAVLTFHSSRRTYLEDIFADCSSATQAEVMSELPQFVESSDRLRDQSLWSSHRASRGNVSSYSYKSHAVDFGRSDID
jgi:hypothetical protein